MTKYADTKIKVQKDFTKMRTSQKYAGHSNTKICEILAKKHKIDTKYPTRQISMFVEDLDVYVDHLSNRGRSRNKDIDSSRSVIRDAINRIEKELELLKQAI